MQKKKKIDFKLAQISFEKFVFIICPILMFRKKRFEVFVDKLSPYKAKNILDVGGSSHTWLGTNLEQKVTLLNLTKPKESDLKQNFKAIQADALNMHMYKKMNLILFFRIV